MTEKNWAEIENIPLDLECWEHTKFSPEIISLLKKMVTPSGFKKVRESKSSLGSLVCLPAMKFADLAIYRVYTKDDKTLNKLISSEGDRDKYKRAFKTAQFTIETYARAFDSNRKDCNFAEIEVLFKLKEDSTCGGFISILHCYKYLHPHASHEECEGQSCIYICSNKADSKPCMFVADWDSKAKIKTKEDAKSRVTDVINEFAEWLSRERVCFNCGKIGNSKEFAHCPCDRNRRYCCKDCFLFDWKRHASEHNARMKAALESGGAAEECTDVAIWQAPSEHGSENAVAKVTAALEGSAIDNSTGAAPVRAPPDGDEQVCDFCGQASKLRCTRCHYARYCSKTCQRQHWTEHKYECKQSAVKAPAC